MHLLKLLLLLLLRPRAVLGLMHHRPLPTRPLADMGEEDRSQAGEDGVDRIG
jgi:hypothetical protein